MQDSTVDHGQPPAPRSGVRFWTRRGGAFFLVGGIGAWDVALWDGGEARDELAHLADAGFTFARVAIPWDILQPEPRRLRSLLIDRLVTLLDGCADAGLSLELGVAGALGGVAFVPRWVVPAEPAPDLLTATVPVISEGWEPPLPLRNLYEEESMLAAQAWLWGELTRLLAAHPAFGALDVGLGGLLTLLPPRHPEFALRWWERVRDTHAERAPTWAYRDSITLLEREGLPALPQWRETVGDLALGLPVPGAGADGRVDGGSAAFQMLLAQSLARGAVGCTALGIATSDDARHNAPPPTLGEGETPFYLATEEEQARALSELLPALRALGVPTICAALWADAPARLHRAPPFATYPPLRHAGLLRADGREKEALRIWRAFNAERAPLPADPPRLPLDAAEWRARRYEAGFAEGLRREAGL